MASVGQVYYDVLPNLDRFAAQVAAGVGTQKPVDIKVDADTTKAQASIRGLVGQTGALGAAQRRLANAEGSLRVSGLRLAEVRAKAAAGSSRLASAEESHARALRTLGAAQAAVAASTAKTERGLSRFAGVVSRPEVQSFGRGLIIGGAGAALALGGVVKVTADFEQAVSGVAATGEDARASLSSLREEAIRLGADTSFSAREAANAQEELIKANVSVTDTINGGLKGALDLAAAGSLGVADAAGIMGTALSQFQLPGTQAGKVADLLAAAAGKAQGEVTDFAEALKYVGPNAQAAGVGIEETVGILAEFANQGILGSQAGTSLRSMLVSLTAPVGAGAKALKQYGIETRDASGQFAGFEAVAGELQERLGGLGQAERDAALARIFGKNSLTAATVLYEGGADAVRQWTTAVNDSGFASEVATVKLDNLKGDVEKLKGALESAAIGSGSGANSFLRGVVQNAGEAVDSFNALSPEVQEGSLRVAAFLAGSALAAGGLIKLVGAISATKVALVGLGVTATGARTALAGLSGPGLLAAAGFVAVQVASAALENQLERNSAGVDGYLESLSRLDAAQLDSQFERFGSSFALLGQGIDDTATAFKALADTQNPVSQGFRKVGDAIGMVSTAGALAEEFDKLDKSLVRMDPEKAAEAFSILSKQARDAGLTTEEVASTFDDYKAKQQDLADAAVFSFRASERAAAGNDVAAAAIGRTGAAAQQSADDLAALTEELYSSASASLALSGDAIAVEAAMDAAADAAKRNGESLNISTAKGRENQAALDSLVSSTLAATQAMGEQGKSAAEIVARNERSKRSYIETAQAMGMEEDAAREAADALFAIPDSIRSQVIIAGTKVSRKEARDLNKELESIPAEKRAEIVTIAQTKGAKAARRAMDDVKDKEVIARSKADLKGAKAVKSAMDALRDRLVQARSRGDVSGAKKIEAAMRALRDRTVQAKVEAVGVAAAQARINTIRGKTVVVTTVNKVRKAAVADGSYIDPSWARQSLAGGGEVRGVGGPREDNIAGIDRATGVQTAWVSAREFVVNAMQTARNRSQIETINRGGKWDLIPRRASGGPVGSSVAQTQTAAHRSLTLNLDLGPVFGGVQRLVIDLLEDQDEYTASIGRMR